MIHYAHRFRVPAPRGAVFELFADPRRLDSLTPSWFRLQPTGPLPERLEKGVEIDYRLRWRGLPLRWTSRITDYEEDRFLAYEQKRGPYSYFKHEHLFSDVGPGTEVCDRVFFRTPGGTLFDRFVALPDLRRIFTCRQRLTHERFVVANCIPWTSASSSVIERPT